MKEGAVTLITAAAIALFAIWRFTAVDLPFNLREHKIALPLDAQIFRNLNYSEIFYQEMKEGNFLAANDAVAIETGKFTGRSPKDKYIVKQAPSEHDIDWGYINRPMTPEVYRKLHSLVVLHYNNAKQVYVFDGYCGSNPLTRIKVRFITEIAWQHHFVTNMFIRPESREEIENFVPDFTIINACRVTNPDWKKDGLNSDIFVAFNLEEKTAIIGGTYYGGEMKKGIFSLMNYLLPKQGVMTMHCSANIGKDGDTGK